MDPAVVIDLDALNAADHSRFHARVARRAPPGVQEPEAPAIRSAISQSFFLPGVLLEASPADGLRYQIKRRRITFSMDLESFDQILEVICARLF
jgi:hypothetical protein